MRIFYVELIFTLSTITSFGQSSLLEKLIDQSNLHYIANKAAALRTLAAEAQPDVIRNQFKPQLQAAYQLNYATYNNITGMVFPSFITPISGPPAISNSYNGVFWQRRGSACKMGCGNFRISKIFAGTGNRTN